MNLRHKLSHTPEYRVWQMLRHRCTSPTSPAYANYGGRGIFVCAQWLNDPARFIADMGPRPSSRHEIDRIDNDGPYSPENCRWVLRKINDRNRRSSRRITVGDAEKTVAEWSELSGVSATTIIKRLNSGWTPYDAVTTPAREYSKGAPKDKQRKPCPGCGAEIRITGTHCIRCSNKRRRRA